MIDVLDYDDYLTVVRIIEGGQDPDTGIPLPPTETTVLTTAADVQQDDWRIRRSREGDASRNADAIVYVPLRADLTAVRVDDTATVEYAGRIESGRIVAISHFDSLVYLAWQ